MPEPIVVHVENKSAFAGCLQVVVLLGLLCILGVIVFFLLVAKTCSSVVQPPAPTDQPYKPYFKHDEPVNNSAKPDPYEPYFEHDRPVKR